MADRHTRPKVRLRSADHDWLIRHADASGRSFAAVLADAIAEYRDRAEREPPATPPRHARLTRP